MKNALRATSPALKATVFLGMAALLVAGCASKKSSASSSIAPTSAAPAASSAVVPAASSAAAPAATSAAAAAPSSAAGLAPAVATASAAGPAGPATVAVKMGPLGKYLTDASGNTLYIFTPDTTSASTCYTNCITYWPALLTNGGPAAGTGAIASMLGTSQRTDGTTQVTYNGHPLYYFAGDKSAGDTSGQGKENTWFLLSAAGTQIGHAAAPSASASNAAKAVTPTPTRAGTPTPTRAGTPSPTKAGTPSPSKVASPTPTQIAAPAPAPAPTPTKSAVGGGWA